MTSVSFRRSRSRPAIAAGVIVVLLAAIWLERRQATPSVPPVRGVTVCGPGLCRDGSPWQLYGATVYNPGLHPARSGIDDPAGTVALARAAHLNTIRLVNYYPDTGDPATVPFDERSWRKVDRMIGAAGKAGMTVALDLADYRNIQWNDCINPYASDWTRFVSFVGNRRNTVTGTVYSRDHTLSLVSIAGEPLPVGDHPFTARTTGSPCSIGYTGEDITRFFHHAMAEWNTLGGTVLVTSGGLGFLDFNSGIDWRAIFSLPQNAACEIKTYGGMLAFAQTVASYCHGIGKPLIDEEFGWRQGDGDAARAAAFDATMQRLRSLHAAGVAFWNLGYEAGPQSYEVNPGTPLTFAAVQRGAPAAGG